MTRSFTILELTNVHSIYISLAPWGLNILHIAALEYLFIIDVDTLAMLFHLLVELAKVYSFLILLYFEARSLHDGLDIEIFIHTLISSKIVGVLVLFGNAKQSIR